MKWIQKTAKPHDHSLVSGYYEITDLAPGTSGKGFRLSYMGIPLHTTKTLTQALELADKHNQQRK